MYSVAVITGTRAEYGLLRPVIEKIQDSKLLELRLVVTGSHLSHEFGYTIKEIEQDGIPVSASVDILSELVPPGRQGTARRTLFGLDHFIQYFSDHPPDVVLVLGDRYEIFAAAQAAALLDIPIAHISGGDVTHGADDDWFRHCITKMAKLHFPSCEEYKMRVIRMGEQPPMVHNVGGLGDENIRNIQLMSLLELSQNLGIEIPQPYALVGFHPETATGILPQTQARELLSALDKHPGLFYLFTKANADAGGDIINKEIQEYCAAKGGVVYASLGTLRYLSAMKHAKVVIGNSSSGIAETPSLAVPTVNIGQRQAGRERSANIIDCPLNAQEIDKAITLALSQGFQNNAKTVKSPYNGGDTSGKIVLALEAALQQGSLLGPKIFYDRKG